MTAPAEHVVDSSAQAEPVEDNTNGGWDEAEAVFEEEAELPPEETKETESHLEQEQEQEQQQEHSDEPDYLNLDDLPVPHKYKGEVKERIKSVVEGLEKSHSEQVQKFEQDVSQRNEVLGAFVHTFQDIAKDPGKMSYYVQKYGKDLGIDPSQFKAPSGGQEQEQEPSHVAQTQGIGEIVTKYAPTLMQESDPRVWMATMGNMLNEAFEANTQAIMKKVGTGFSNFHEKYVKPTGETMQQYQERMQQDQAVAMANRQATSWDNAFNELKEADGEVSHYQKQIQKALLEDPAFSAAREALNNKAPDDVAGRKNLIHSVYLMVAKNNPRRPAKPSGLRPSGKNVPTKNQGGSDWDEIENDPELGWTE